MNINAIAQDVFQVKAENYSIVYNGAEAFSLKFFVDGSALIVTLSTEKITGLVELIQSSLARGKIV